MAVVEKWVDPNAPGGGDGSSGSPYQSWDEWNTNEQTDLVAAQDQHILYCRAGTDYVEATFNGWVTNATYNVTIKAEAGSEHLGVFNAGFRKSETVDWNYALDIRDDYFTFEDVEFHKTATANRVQVLYNRGNAVGNVYRRILFDGRDQTGTQVFISEENASAPRSIYEACLIVGSTEIALRTLNFQSATYNNCTFVKHSKVGIRVEGTGGGDSVFNNTVSFSSASANPDYDGTRLTGDSSAAGDGTAPGINPIQAIVEGDFTDYTNDDFTIAGTGSQLYDAGNAANLPALGINRQPFTTSDVGCFPYQATGGDPADIDLPSKQVHVQAFVPEISAPFPADIDLPSEQVHVQAFAPQVEAPSGADVDLPSKQIHVQAFAPQVGVPSGADVDLPSKQVHIQAFVPDIEAPFPANIDLPSKQVHVQAFAPIVNVPTGADVNLPSKQVHVQAFAPNIDAPTDAFIDLPSKQVHVQAFAPMVVTGEETISLPPATFVHVRAFNPEINAPSAVDVDLPSKQIHVQAFAPIVQTVSDVFVNLPSKQIHVRGFSPTVDVNQPIFSNLPSKQIYVRAFAPRVQAGLEEGYSLWESIEDIKMAIKPKIEALGLTQIMWPNIPVKRDSKIPFVQISIAPNDRELGDLGGLHRTIGILVTALHTPYGNEPGLHNRYVDGLIKMVSNTYLKGHILFLTSIPITIGRRDSWWVTNIETEFYLEGV